MDLPRVNQSPLMSLKHGHVHAKHAAALRATEPGCVPHHIDNVDPQRRLMRVDARSQMVERWRSMLIHRLVLSGQVSRQGSDCDSMRHSAGTAGKDQVCGGNKLFDAQTEGVHGEALLKECAAGINRRHPRVRNAAKESDGPVRSTQRLPQRTESGKNRATSSCASHANSPDGEPVVPCK